MSGVHASPHIEHAVQANMHVNKVIRLICNLEIVQYLLLHTMLRVLTIFYVTSFYSLCLH